MHGDGGYYKYIIFAVPEGKNVKEFKKNVKLHNINEDDFKHFDLDSKDSGELEDSDESSEPAEKTIQRVEFEKESREKQLQNKKSNRKEQNSRKHMIFDE